MTPFVTVHSFPNELLEVIFEFAVRMPAPANELYPYQPLFSKLPLQPLLPTSLSQVCSRWRDVSLKMPILWCFLHLTRSQSTHRRLKADPGRSFDWLNTYIARSGDLLLEVTLDCTRLPLEAAMSMITPHSARWRSLRLLVSHVGILPVILPHLENSSVPALECLSIEADIYREGIISPEPLPPFFTSGAPLLSTISLKGVYLAWNGPPLLGLTTLELRFSTRWPSFIELREMFYASPLLNSLIIQDDVDAIGRNVDQPATMPVIELSHLHYLELIVHRRREADSDVTGLIGLFLTPMLETLTLRGLRESEWLRVVNHYRVRAAEVDFPLVRTLILSDIYGQITSGFRVCEAFPRLFHLSLTRVNSNGFTELLVQGHDRRRSRLSPIWPFLCYLEIREDQYCSLSLLQSVIDSRRALGKPPLTITVDGILLAS